jgi:1-pyrroline-5-carboxylate dehydrogenase
VEAGHAILERLHARRPLRPAILEMGGKNPAIVRPSADLDRAAEGIVRAAFGLSGQKCSACSRVVVERSVHDELVDRIVELTRGLVVGDPSDPDSSLGPVIDADAVERYNRASALAHRTGRVVAGGGQDPRAGYFVQPTVVCDLPHGHLLTRDELFLPLVTVTAADGFDDALTEANAVAYGLTAGIFTADLEEQDAFLEGAEAASSTSTGERGPPPGRGRGCKRSAAGSKAARRESAGWVPTICSSSCASRAGR